MQKYNMNTLEDVFLALCKTEEEVVTQKSSKKTGKK